MTEIVIPFSREMQEAVLNGKKLCTTRSEAKGIAGDVFQVRNVWCRILEIQEMDIGVASDTLFRCEGCGSPHEFRVLWRRYLHGHYLGQKRCYVHFFAIIPLWSDPRTGASLKSKQPSLDNPASSHSLGIESECPDNPVTE